MTVSSFTLCYTCWEVLKWRELLKSAQIRQKKEEEMEAQEEQKTRRRKSSREGEKKGGRARVTL